jgi:Helix-turn-helix of DDE superfamily endonuclease
LSHRICTGLPRRRLGKLIAELAGPWAAQQESRLRERRGGRDRLRAEGAGPNRELPFTDRVIATLAVLRFQLPHAAVGLFYGVDRSTITRAVHEIRPLLAARGFAVPGEPGLRLRTLADVFAYAPPKVCTCASTAPRCRSAGPGPTAQAAARSCPAKEAEHDQAHRHQRWPGTAALARRDPPRPQARCHRAAHRGHQGPAPPLPRRHRRRRLQIPGPGPRFPQPDHRPTQETGKDATPSQVTEREAARKQQSSRRICIEHAIAEPKQWRTLQRYTGRREYFEDTALAIGGLISDRCANR